MKAGWRQDEDRMKTEWRQWVRWKQDEDRMKAGWRQWVRWTQDEGIGLVRWSQDEGRMKAVGGWDEDRMKAEWRQDEGSGWDEGRMKAGWRQWVGERISFFLWIKWKIEAKRNRGIILFERRQKWEELEAKIEEAFLSFHWCVGKGKEIWKTQLTDQWWIANYGPRCMKENEKLDERKNSC